MASVARATVAIGIFSHGDHFLWLLVAFLLIAPWPLATVANRKRGACTSSSDSSAALAALLIGEKATKGRFSSDSSVGRAGDCRNLTILPKSLVQFRLRRTFLVW